MAKRSESLLFLVCKQILAQSILDLNQFIIGAYCSSHNNLNGACHSNPTISSSHPDSPSTRKKHPHAYICLPHGFVIRYSAHAHT